MHRPVFALGSRTLGSLASAASTETRSAIQELTQYNADRFLHSNRWLTSSQVRALPALPAELIGQRAAEMQSVANRRLGGVDAQPATALDDVVDGAVSSEGGFSSSNGSANAIPSLRIYKEFVAPQFVCTPQRNSDSSAAMLIESDPCRGVCLTMRQLGYDFVPRWHHLRDGLDDSARATVHSYLVRNQLYRTKRRDAPALKTAAATTSTSSPASEEDYVATAQDFTLQDSTMATFYKFPHEFNQPGFEQAVFRENALVVANGGTALQWVTLSDAELADALLGYEARASVEKSLYPHCSIAASNTDGSEDVLIQNFKRATMDTFEEWFRRQHHSRLAPSHVFIASDALEFIVGKDAMQKAVGYVDDAEILEGPKVRLFNAQETSNPFLIDKSLQHYDIARGMQPFPPTPPVGSALGAQLRSGPFASTCWVEADQAKDLFVTKKWQLKHIERGNEKKVVAPVAVDIKSVCEVINLNAFEPHHQQLFTRTMPKSRKLSSGRSGQYRMHNKWRYDSQLRYQDPKKSALSNMWISSHDLSFYRTIKPVGIPGTPPSMWSREIEMTVTKEFYNAEQFTTSASATEERMAGSGETERAEPSGAPPAE